MIRAVYQHLYGLVRKQALNCSLSFTSRCLRSVLFVCVCNTRPHPPPNGCHGDTSNAVDEMIVSICLSDM